MTLKYLHGNANSQPGSLIQISFNLDMSPMEGGALLHITQPQSILMRKMLRIKSFAIVRDGDNKIAILPVRAHPDEGSVGMAHGVAHSFVHHLTNRLKSDDGEPGWQIGSIEFDFERIRCREFIDDLLQRRSDCFLRSIRA